MTNRFNENFFKLKKVTQTAARFFVYSKCNKATNGVREVQQDVMCDEVETVKGFCYLGNRLNVSGECEAAVTARTRLVWKKFKKCQEILFEKRFSLRMKGKVCTINYVIWKRNGV